MKKFIFSLLVISSALFGNNQSSISSFVFDKYFDMGNYYANLKKDDLAIKNYTKAIELNPNYADAYFGRGYSYNKIKNYELSIKDYKKAIELNPNITDAYMNIFERQMIIGKKFDKSLKENFVKLFSNDKQAFIYYEIIQILQSIDTNEPYVLSLEEWSKKYKDTKLGCWNWHNLDEWANATKDNEKKAKLQNAIKIFKEHGEGKK